MAFIQKSVTEEHLFGGDLRQLRELRGWTREQLTAATGIRPSVIAAFEDGVWEAIGDLEYAERHVKLLVTALEGNVPFMLGKYRLALKAAQALNQDQVNLSFVRRVRRRELFAPSRYVALLLLFPPIIFIGWYVWRQGAAVSSPPRLEVREPADQAVLSDPHVRIVGLTDPAASVSVNGVLAVVGSDGEFAASVDVPRGTTRLEVLALKRYGGRNTVLRYVTYSPLQGPQVPLVLPMPVTSTSATSTAATTSKPLRTVKKSRPRTVVPTSTASSTIR